MYDQFLFKGFINLEWHICHKTVVVTIQSHGQKGTWKKQTTWTWKGRNLMLNKTLTFKSSFSSCCFWFGVQLGYLTQKNRENEWDFWNQSHKEKWKISTDEPGLSISRSSIQISRLPPSTLSLSLIWYKLKSSNRFGESNQTRLPDGVISKSFFTHHMFHP